MNKQRGVSLIEVMIALAVFAIGVGGMAGLQLRSLSLSMDSKQRSVVLAKTQELADRMRVNPASLKDYVGTKNNDGDTYCSAAPADNCADSNAGSATGCAGQQMAAFDLWDAFCRADSGLDNTVIEWSTEVSCSSAACEPGLDTVTILTTWISRTGDTNKDLIVTTGETGIDPTRDQLSLSFIP